MVMNRRNFIKTTSGALASLPFIPKLFGITPVSDELKDLYAFLESKTIKQYAIWDDIPFKLYPFQKEILKTIHENDKVVIVKARQIGGTTLLSGYGAWADTTNRGLYLPFCSSSCMYEHFSRLGRSFGRYSSGKYVGLMLDEYNYSPHFENVIKNSDLSKHCKKLIVVGTPDKQGRLKKFVDTHPEFKVVYYPVTKCPELYPISRIASYETYVGKQNMDRELFAKLT